MHWVYPLKGASRNGHAELRYSLRALACHTQGARPVILTDSPPAWYRGDVIRLPGQGAHKREITTRKLHHYAKETTERHWMLMCDDFYLSRSTDWERLPLLHGPDLREAAQGYYRSRHKSNNIARIWEHTADILESHDLPTRSYELHLPLRIVTDLWLDAPGIDRYAERPGIQPQSLYGNYAHAQGEAIREEVDLKFWRIGHDEENLSWEKGRRVQQRTQGRIAWSTSDCAAQLNSWEGVMSELYPEPSPWEESKAVAA